MTEYETRCPVCGETITHEGSKETKDIAVEILEFKLNNHITAEHTTVEILITWVKRVFIE